MPLSYRFRWFFREYDSDKDGFIALEQLRPLLMDVCLGLAVPELQLEETIQSLNAKGDGFATL